MWAPGSDWSAAYNPGLQPTSRSTADQAYTLSVDSVKIETLDQLPMIFGAMYDESASGLFYSDNVGITPLILKSTTLKSFNFSVDFQSIALPGDH